MALTAFALPAEFADKLQPILYKPDRNTLEVKAVEAALEACSREQLAYLFSEVLPIFHANLIRKDDHVDPTDGLAERDQASHGAD